MRSLTLTKIFLTHGHFDHIGAVKKLHDETGVKVAIGTFENDALSRPEINLSHKFRLAFEPFSADILLSDGDEITVGNYVVKHANGNYKKDIQKDKGSSSVISHNVRESPEIAHTDGRTDACQNESPAALEAVTQSRRLLSFSNRRGRPLYNM